MKNILLAMIIAMGLVHPVVAQFSNVTYDYEMSYFNENQPLPSEKAMMITGNIPDEIDMVEISFFSPKGKDSRAPLTTSIWKRPHDKKGGNFKVPVNFKLRSSKKYDVRLNYYRGVGQTEKQEVYNQLVTNLDAYLDQTFQVKKKGIKLSSHHKQVIADMNDIVNNGLSKYRTWSDVEFPGFSDIVKQKIKSMGDVNLSDGQHLFTKDEKKDARNNYRQKLTKDVKKMVHSEVQFILNNDLAVLSDTQTVEDYETDKRSSYFSVNVGYGAVYLNGSVDNLTYDTSPYLGISVPLSTSTIAPKFFRNASLTVGFFTNNFTDENDEEVSGPIFKRPLYTGLDYKLFQFIRFNAGVALLEGVSDEIGNITGIEKRVFVKPFVGISAKINISLSLDK